MTDREFVLHYFPNAFIHTRSRDLKAHKYHVHNGFDELGKRCATKDQAWKSASDKIKNNRLTNLIDDYVRDTPKNMAGKI